MNPWILHVKSYQQLHNCTYKEALQRSKATYNKASTQKGEGIVGDLMKALGFKDINLFERFMSGYHKGAEKSKQESDAKHKKRYDEINAPAL